MAALPNAQAPDIPTLEEIAALLGLEKTLENTFGAYLVCTCLGCMLFGLTTHQTYRYFRLYPSDSKSLKSLVILVLGLDVVHTILTVHICYFYLVTNYFHPERLAEGVWSIRLVILNTGLMILCAHCFYARRLFFLSNRNIFPVAIIALLLAVEIGFSIASAYESFAQVTFARFIQYSYLLWTVISCAVAVDCVATGTLTYYLHKSRTGFRRTDSMVDVLMVYTVNTGLSTSIVTIAALICAVTMKSNLIYSGIITIATKMYSNSLLAVLNSRRSLVDKGMEGFETGSFGLRVIEPPEKPSDQREIRPISFKPPTPRAMRNARGIDVKVTTETFIDITAQNDALRSSAEHSERK
ncbi:hypothetical protein FKP32DRAFT_1681943 [Trametes sanguinea]|nr:hypothetical protein FKP32DRAFT_1681943 [Trametes sanguinea]